MFEREREVPWNPGARFRIAALLLVLSLASGCSVQREEVRHREPGQSFQTRAGCVRSENVDTFDRRCDVPLLGYSGFNGL